MGNLRGSSFRQENFIDSDMTLHVEDILKDKPQYISNYVYPFGCEQDQTSELPVSNKEMKEMIFARRSSRIRMMDKVDYNPRGYFLNNKEALNIMTELPNSKSKTKKANKIKKRSSVSTKQTSSRSKATTPTIPNRKRVVPVKRKPEPIQKSRTKSDRCKRNRDNSIVRIDSERRATLRSGQPKIDENSSKNCFVLTRRSCTENQQQRHLEDRLAIAHFLKGTKPRLRLPCARTITQRNVVKISLSPPKIINVPHINKKQACAELMSLYDLVSDNMVGSFHLHIKSMMFSAIEYVPYYRESSPRS